VALSGCDVLGCIKTWFGKTIAFALPLIQHCLAQPLVQQKDGPMVLVLALTKVVQQIKKKVKVFIQFVQGFKITICCWRYKYTWSKVGVDMRSWGSGCYPWKIHWSSSTREQLFF
jgi:superfamily II DNA/RNA helicase